GVQNNIYSSKQQQLKLEYEGNLGFITDVNAGFSWRWGRINSPWWAFNPYQSKYMQQSMPIFSSNSTESKDEFYLWAGARLNLRIYNALLQGQFRHSEVTVSSSDMERLVAEYWFGATMEFTKKYYASFFIRGHTEEFTGPNARGAAWAGIVFSRAY
ncbi:MAG: lipid A deacylase LpxR family protein, partial [Gammaproteobacteria bacterium]|nr:lipid A deacylase LpxR family protein [Gammaproteobacteria bacterium]